jgi:hypothetical protein
MYETLMAEKLNNAIREHIVTVFLTCQITIKNVQVQLTVKGKTTPDSYTSTPKSSCPEMKCFVGAKLSVTTHKTSTVAMLDLTDHMIIWGGLFTHGDGSTGLMKVVFCYALPTVVQGMPTACHLSGMVNFRCTIPNQ